MFGAHYGVSDWSHSVAGVGNWSHSGTIVWGHSGAGVGVWSHPLEVE